MSTVEVACTLYVREEISTVIEKACTFHVQEEISTVEKACTFYVLDEKVKEECSEFQGSIYRIIYISNSSCLSDNDS